VYDGLGALGGAAQAVGIGHVSLNELAAPRSETLVPLRAACEHANSHILRPERMDDVTTDETRAPDDEDGHSKFRASEKFFQ
jgi:hypothetical protein